MRGAYRNSCLFPVHMAEVQVRFFSSLFAVIPYGFYNNVCFVNKSYTMRTFVIVIRVDMYLLE